MSYDERRMQELGRMVREEREAKLGELERPLDAREIDRIATNVAATFPAHPRRARRWPMIVAAAAVPLAMAAAAVLVLRPSPPGAMVAYELVVDEGGDQRVRSGTPVAESETVHVVRGGRLVLVARPRTPKEGAISATAAVELGGAARPWVVHVDVSSEGAVRLEADAEATAALPAGDSRLLVFVGDPSRLPRDAAATSSAAANPPTGVTLLARAMNVAP